MSPRTSSNGAGGLAERAMLVRLATSRWYGVITDKAAGKELAEEKGAQEDMLSLRKKLINPKALSPINGARTEARMTHMSLTLPWQDGGTRILASAGYFTYTEKMRKVIAKFDEKVEEFIPHYMEWYNESAKLLGKLHRLEEYPRSGEQLRRRFALTINFYPIPQGTDFRCKVTADDEKAIRSQIEQDVHDTVAEAMREPWKRMHEKVAHLIKRLRGDGAFYRSNVDNIRELVEIMPLLNITNDSKLAAITKEIQKELLVDPDTVKDDDKLRAATADKADKILEKMSAFI